MRNFYIVFWLYILVPRSREHRNYRSYAATTCTLAVPKDSAVFQNLFIVTEGWLFAFLCFLFLFLFYDWPKSNVKESQLRQQVERSIFYERKHTVFKRPAFESIVVIRLDCRMEAPLWMWKVDRQKLVSIEISRFQVKYKQHWKRMIKKWRQ